MNHIRKRHEIQAAAQRVRAGLRAIRRIHVYTAKIVSHTVATVYQAPAAPRRTRARPAPHQAARDQLTQIYLRSMAKLTEVSAADIIQKIAHRRRRS